MKTLDLAASSIIPLPTFPSSSPRPPCLRGDLSSSCLILAALTAGAILAFPQAAVAGDGPPDPWVPPKVSGATVSTWGQTLAFDKGPLPNEIAVAGVDLLAGPARLELDGRADAIQWQHPSVLRRDGSTVLLACRGTSTGLRWKAETEIAFDGLTWVTIDVTAATPGASLERLSLRVPVIDATLYSHQLVRTAAMNPGWRAHFYDAPENLWNAGRLPEEGWSGQFTPQVWTGGFERGLAVYAETPEHWAVDDSSDIMFLRRTQDRQVEIRVDFAQRRLEPGAGWQIGFGLQPTPMRPPVNRPEAFRAVYTGGSSLARQEQSFLPPEPSDSALNDMARDGARIILLWNSWSDYWGFPKVTDPEYRDFLRGFLDRAHGLGLKVVPYCGALAAISDHHPEFEARSRQFIISRKEYHPDPFHEGRGNYRVIPTPEFTEWYLANLRELLAEFAFDGVYLDTINKPDFPLQGDRVVYSMRAWRQFYEGIYRVFHGEGGRRGFVYFHDSDPNIFMLDGLADIRLSGEMQYYSAAQRGEVRQAMPDLDNRMPLERYFVWTSGYPLGNLPTMWCRKDPLAQHYSVGRGVVRQQTRVGDMLSDEEDFALAGLFNMGLNLPPTSLRKNVPGDLQAAIWKAEDRILADRPTWFGYWKAHEYVRLDPAPDTAAAGWLVPGKKLLLHVANLRAATRDIDVQLLASTALAGKKINVTDPLPPRESTVAAGVKLHLTPNSFVRVLVEAADCD